MPEKVPLWVIQNTFMSYGGRSEKRPATMSQDMKVCATCQTELYKPLDWNYCEEKYYCNGKCIQDARKAQAARWEKERLERQQQWENTHNSRGEYLRGRRIGGGYTPAPVVSMSIVPKTEAEIPAGNLEECWYQYWVGTLDDSLPRHVLSTRATCRACGAVVHGALGREIHKKESAAFYKDGFSCMKVLAMAIRSMVNLRNCIVCRTVTNKKHYGVPLCSPNCHKIWRFSEKVQYPELELAIAPYWATDLPNTPATGGSSTSESTSNSTKHIEVEYME